MSRRTPNANALFSEQWLTLREPADHLARDAQLTHAADSWLTRHADPSRPLEARRTIVDLGCGSGSNLRYLAPRLHGAQHWRLVDHDEELLASARLRCQYLVSADAQPIHLESVNLSLADTLEETLQGAYLVTASALFDLLTADDIGALADACQRSGCAVLFALSIDGLIRFHDASGSALYGDDDRFMLAALQAHQHRDKGDGPAMGSEAPRRLRESFRHRGYHIREAASPWQLGPESLPLAEALMAGWREALHQQLPQQRDRVDQWHARRLDDLLRERVTLTVGHRDLLATPSDRTRSGARA
ncbi:class I SAM-dependent methyltransferase [Salinicola corii]|uniref:Class I SAM-dependent methyltransferase n=1 Tax=Salinicola corii TaxID=2606937 RepID=A0A640WJ83_9GAMM|nr:class I SAM-dependent methyltransferase [Salinicola corii]KAA0020703.1 class I SAM-dependent methyltransferase [Salinicola corii]